MTSNTRRWFMRAIQYTLSIFFFWHYVFLNFFRKYLDFKLLLIYYWSDFSKFPKNFLKCLENTYTRKFSAWKNINISIINDFLKMGCIPQSKKIGYKIQKLALVSLFCTSSTFRKISSIKPGSHSCFERTRLAKVENSIFSLPCCHALSNPPTSDVIRVRGDIIISFTFC